MNDIELACAAVRTLGATASQGSVDARDCALDVLKRFLNYHSPGSGVAASQSPRAAKPGYQHHPYLTAYASGLADPLGHGQNGQLG